MPPNSIISWYITFPCILISGWSLNIHSLKSNSSFSIMFGILYSQNHSQTHILYFFEPWSLYLSWTLQVSCNVELSKWVTMIKEKKEWTVSSSLSPIKSHTVQISQLSFKFLQLTAKSMESKTETEQAKGHSHLLYSKPHYCLRAKNVCHPVSNRCLVLSCNCESAAAAANSICVYKFILWKQKLKWVTTFSYCISIQNYELIEENFLA